MHKEASQQESVALQRLAGREWHRTGDEKKVQHMMESGSSWHKDTATEDEREAQKSSGRNWCKTASPEELAAVKRCGAEWHRTGDEKKVELREG